MKIASVVATGVGQPEAGRFAADSIEVSDIEIDANIAGPTGGKLTYKVPRFVVKDYSGPAKLQQLSASASIIDVYRSGLEQFATISAASVSAPSITGTINFGAVMSGEFVYSGTALRDIKDGKIATMQVERANFTVNAQQAGKADKMTGEMINIAVARLRCQRRCRHPRSAKGQRRPVLPRLRQDNGRPLHRHVCARRAHAHRRDDRR